MVDRRKSLPKLHPLRERVRDLDESGWIYGDNRRFLGKMRWGKVMGKEIDKTPKRVSEPGIRNVSGLISFNLTSNVTYQSEL